jgi:hypothetical protein
MNNNETENSVQDEIKLIYDKINTKINDYIMSTFLFHDILLSKGHKNAIIKEGYFLISQQNMKIGRYTIWVNVADKDYHTFPDQYKHILNLISLSDTIPEDYKEIEDGKDIVKGYYESYKKNPRDFWNKVPTRIQLLRKLLKRQK